MRKVAKKVCKLSLFSQLSAPIKSGVRHFPYFPNNIFEEYFRQFFWTQTAQIFVENIPRKKRPQVDFFSEFGLEKIIANTLI